MVLAVEQPIEDLAQRADMMEVIQDDDKGHVHSIVLTVALISKVGQVLAQFLWWSGRTSCERTPRKMHVLSAFIRPESGKERALHCAELYDTSEHLPATGNWLSVQGILGG
jgi:hypothetical protein